MAEYPQALFDAWARAFLDYVENAAKEPDRDSHGASTTRCSTSSRELGSTRTSMCQTDLVTRKDNATDQTKSAF